jgi:hypothetical protein
LEELTVNKNGKGRRQWASLSKKEKSFISEIKERWERWEDGEQMDVEDGVRNAFH